MGNFKISIEQYRGTSYDIGYRQGRYIDQSLIDMCSRILDIESVDIDEMKKVYSFAPHLLEELSGLADAMHVSFDEAAVFGGYGALQIPGMGCSSVVNSQMLVRNYDFSPEVYDARLVFVQPKEGYASVGHSLHVMGRTEGVNEKGLAIALHFVNNQKGQRGLAASGVIRIVLDQCKDTYEAIAMIKQLPHSWCYNFSIGDSEGNTVVVEQSPIDTRIRKNNDVLFCTNHFQNQGMMELNRENNVVTRSQERLNYLHNSDLERMSVRKVFDTFRDAHTPLYNEEYNEFFGTLHTFAYQFNQNKVLTAIPGGDVLEIDFNEWIKGKNINQKELIGNLNTN